MCSSAILARMDYARIARELLIALRGPRSQVAWSRRLGYRSNVAYAWEAGRRWPTAAETFRAAARSNIDLEEALGRFYGRPPPWLAGADLTTPGAVARLLDDLRGQTTVTDFARRASVGRSSLTRWLGGQTEPRLPDFLRVVECASLRLVDLLAALVDPARIPSIVETSGQLEARRQSAAQAPWTQDRGQRSTPPTCLDLATTLRGRALLPAWTRPQAGGRSAIRRLWGERPAAVGGRRRKLIS